MQAWLTNRVSRRKSFVSHSHASASWKGTLSAELVKLGNIFAGEGHSCNGCNVGLESLQSMMMMFEGETRHASLQFIRN